ncbi:TetR/AcrR family transcriptional regulator [Nocardia sp. NBC_00508]|uniref:TetR/AcrR family transcriptional regulator n=1 Tax=Nocardia sp. NBC_00508 TaxID=2975992 RepID=UPI002E80AABC|nr:helix-turn-helix domain-containing protein [Nocardia sp. NBC_00508]WUD64713.1 TetR/AcrR family transcriptional regulator [Nocardia sp. NBC_00508]
MSKRDWLDAGFAVLAEDGARALTVERLCADLGLTKGSFYHHFRGMSGYRTDLLEHFETEYTGRYIAEAERVDAPARDKLARLRSVILADHETEHALEIAMRAWAMQDPEVYQLHQRVDQRRVDYVESLLRDVGEYCDESEPLARLLYLALIGAQQVIPPLPAQDIAEMYAFVLRMATKKEE